MIKFIHTADIHLDSPLIGLEVHEDAPVDQLRQATRRAFDSLVDFALDQEVNFILITGDLYDGEWKDYNTGLFFAHRMGRLSRAGIKVFIVSGNHDAASQITRAMPLPDSVTLFSSKTPTSFTLEELGIIIHGQSYASRAVTQNLAANFPLYQPGYFNIGLLHTALTGREGHEVYAPCTLDELKSRGYDYWALGHVHKREIICEEPLILFPGNIQGRHIRETGAKGATLVTLEEGKISGVEALEFDVLRWVLCSVDLSGCETPENVHESVRQAFEQELDLAGGKPLALRLVLTGKSPVHARLLDNTPQWIEQFRGIAASAGNMWLERVKFQTSRLTGLEEILYRETPIAGLLQSIQSLGLDGHTLMGLVPELAALKAKLPAELFSNGELFWDPDAGRMEQLRTEVQELLIAKLLAHGGGK